VIGQNKVDSARKSSGAATWLRVQNIATRAATLLLACFTMVAMPTIAQTHQYGGSAPAPACTENQRSNCTPSQSFYGAEPAAQAWCTQFAAAHMQNGGSQPLPCDYTGSVVLSCALSDPPVAPSFAGGASAVVGVVLSAQNVYDQLSWGGSYGGPFCQCSGGSLLTEQATCACPVGKAWSSDVQACVGLNEIFEDKTPASNCPYVGDPIYPLTGVLKESQETGISLAGIPLTLTYDTTNGLAVTGASSGPLFANANGFGRLWTSSYHRYLQVTPGMKGAVVFQGDGTVLNFSGDGSGAFTSATPDNRNRLVNISGRYQLSEVASADVLIFDGSGFLQTIQRPDGRTLSFTYSSGQLVQVQDDSGRAIQFGYTNDVVAQIIDPDQAVTTAGYDAAKNLISLTWPDSQKRTFVYGNSAHPWALTSVVDENGATQSTFTYDSDGRAIGTEAAGGTNKYSVESARPAYRLASETYNAASQILTRVYSWDAAQGVSITRPDGVVVGWASQDIAGHPVLTSQTQPAGSGCAAAASSILHDATGNVTQRDDFSGARSCYQYDPQGREIARIEGVSSADSCSTLTATGALLPAGARRITTSWHPDWNMPVTVTEPLKKTSVIYQGQPDPFASNATANCTGAPNRADGKPLPLLCKRVEQGLRPDGTVDSQSPAHMQTYSYDNAGRALAHTDANSHTSTVAFYSDSTFSGPDAYAASVSLLLDGECDGCDQVIDRSANAAAPTATTGVHITTADKKSGNSSISIAAGSGIAFPGQAGLLMTGDYTLEGWAKVSNRADIYFFVITTTEAPNRVAIFTSSSGALLFNRYGYNSVYFNSASNLFPLNTWFHLACERAGQTISCYVNGQVVGSLSDGGTEGNGVGGIQLNSGSSSGILWDDVRVTKGVARYSGNFTPSPLPIFSSNTGAGHLVGDVQSVTDASGHIVQYTVYDRAGRVQHFVDSKGVATETTYMPRGWVKTVTVTPPGGVARTTTYSYDGVGQVAGVSQPDGTSVHFSYDAAHRLIGASDARGNSVTYTLDSFGNRTGEDVKDASGTLRRSISRAFDALNRVQQVTGSAN
jgi:YD repeat-containing protein